MIARKQIHNRDRAGFTLMELLVVVAIIVILAGVGGFTFMKTLEDQKVNSAIMKANTIYEAVKVYAIDHDGAYPDTLDQLLTPDANNRGPYLEGADKILDPWGNRYNYDPAGPQHANIGALVTIPDISTTVPKTGMTVGNWPLPKT